MFKKQYAKSMNEGRMLGAAIAVFVALIGVAQRIRVGEVTGRILVVITAMVIAIPLYFKIEG